MGSSDGRLYAIDIGSDDPAGKWRFRTGDSVIASPAATGDHVFAASTSGNVFAILPEAGETVWRFETETDVREGPAVTDEWLYFGDIGGTVYALGSD